MLEVVHENTDNVSALSSCYNTCQIFQTPSLNTLLSIVLVYFCVHCSISMLTTSETQASTYVYTCMSTQLSLDNTTLLASGSASVSVTFKGMQIITRDIMKMCTFYNFIIDTARPSMQVNHCVNYKVLILKNECLII